VIKTLSDRPAGSDAVASKCIACTEDSAAGGMRDDKQPAR